MVANKNIISIFFAPLSQGSFRCNLCGCDRKQVAGSGYSNLVAHLAGQHSGYEAQYATSLANASRSLQSFGFVSEEASHLFQWIPWIIERNMPVHEVEDVLTRAMSKLRPVTATAVKKCMEGIAIKVSFKLEKELGTLFGLMFDGWTHAGVHDIGLYAGYETDGVLRVPLLPFPPPPFTDGTQTADAHVQLFENIIDVYNKTKDVVGFLVGDNRSTNRLIATKMDAPLVGCASHRFNLAVNKYLAPHETILDVVNDLMVALRHENNFAELKKHTELLPVTSNATQWSSTFTMVQRYIRIRPEIKKVEAVKELIPTGGKHRKLIAPFEHLKKFESICKRLQREDTDMTDVRMMFDALVKEYLKANAKIVHTPAF